MKQQRGELTKRVQKKAVKLLGREITEQELRFMPYLQYCMMNEQRFERAKIYPEEREIIDDWNREGWIKGKVGDYKIAIDKKFWKKLNEIMYIAYVDTTE